MTNLHFKSSVTVLVVEIEVIWADEWNRFVQGLCAEDVS